MRKVRSKKEEKRRKRLMITSGILALLILVSLIIYKGYVYLDEMSKIDDTTIIIKNNINIKEISNSCNVSDGYISLYIPAEFKKNTNSEASWYDLNYVDDDNRDAAIAFFEMSDFKKSIGSVEESDTDSKVLERNKIKNGFDLIKYYYDSQEKSISIFSSNDNIKLNRMAIKYIASLAKSTKITILTGDVEGILFKNDKSYHVVVYDKDNAAAVDFYNGNEEYFNDDNVIDFISMIEFN